MYYKAYNTYTDYVNVFFHGNKYLRRKAVQPTLRWMSAIAVGYAATPFCFSYFLFLYVIVFDAVSASILKTSFKQIVCWKIIFNFDLFITFFFFVDEYNKST